MVCAEHFESLFKYPDMELTKVICTCSYDSVMFYYHADLDTININFIIILYTENLVVIHLKF